MPDQGKKHCLMKQAAMWSVLFTRGAPDPHI